MNAYFICHLSIGALTLREEDGVLTGLHFGAHAEPGANRMETPLLTRAAVQLEEYLRGERTRFTLPLGPQGTEFQRRVWDALQKIPYGETRTYGEIAAAIGAPHAARAVGLANHNNPISICIPCHRVIGANGSLTGYAGGLDLKETLLRLEREHRSQKQGEPAL